MRIKFLASGIALYFVFTTGSLFAAPKITAWLPYWKVDDAVSETYPHLDIMTEVSPFAFTVKADGTLKDNFEEDSEPWLFLQEEAVAQKTKVIPSILWTERSEMEKMLNNSVSRKKHIKSIIAEVKKGKFDGIDIDYEGKSAETRVGFSKFLTELKIELKKSKKLLVCTIEARTPIASRYPDGRITDDLLSQIEYSNDYKVIGKQCDRVRIMTYDQIDGDVKLSNQYASEIYRPVADKVWVRKVIETTLEEIPANKIYLGVATYGYKYEITRRADNTVKYKRLGSMNFEHADALAKNLGITPTRHASGEIFYTYASSTDYGDSNPTGVDKQYMIWYSDALAIKDKYDLAKKYKLAGITIFKLDGSNDPALWSILK